MHRQSLYMYAIYTISSSEALTAISPASSVIIVILILFLQLLVKPLPPDIPDNIFLFFYVIRFSSFLHTLTCTFSFYYYLLSELLGLFP